MVKWRWSDEMQDLYDQCFDWFRGNFSTGQHSSLQVLSRDQGGQGMMLKLFAKSDREMYENARQWMKKHAIAKFVAFGEGQIPGKDRTVPVFILYFQDATDPVVRSAVMPYRKAPQGFEFGDWYETAWLNESWLPAED
jgi:hypothetical protein